MNQPSAMNKSTTLETIYSWRIDFEPAKKLKKHIKNTISIQTHGSMYGMYGIFTYINHTNQQKSR